MLTFMSPGNRRHRKSWKRVVGKESARVEAPVEMFTDEERKACARYRLPVVRCGWNRDSEPQLTYSVLRLVVCHITPATHQFYFNSKV